MGGTGWTIVKNGPKELTGVLMLLVGWVKTGSENTLNYFNQTQ
jgi:hypothetical protein